MSQQAELWRAIPVGQHPRTPVCGDFPYPGGGSGAMRGEFRLQRIERTPHHLRAVGTVTGSLRDGAGRPMGQASRRVVIPLASGTTASLRDALNRVEVDLLGLPVALHVNGSRSAECGSH